MSYYYYYFSALLAGLRIRRLYPQPKGKLPAPQKRFMSPTARPRAEGDIRSIFRWNSGVVILSFPTVVLLF